LGTIPMNTITTCTFSPAILASERGNEWVIFSEEKAGEHRWRRIPQWHREPCENGKRKPGFLAGVLSTLVFAQSRREKT